MEVKLLVAGGAFKGRIIPLPATVVTVGRSSRCHLRPHDLAVSKWHCAIARWAGQVVVRDLNSTNGTFVNERRVHGAVHVLDGDRLTIGSLTFTFRIQNDPVGGLPIQVVNEGEVHWLMSASEGPRMLSALETVDVQYNRPQGETSPTPQTTLALAPTPRELVLLSAGDYLRDYFQQKKNSLAHRTQRP